MGEALREAVAALPERIEDNVYFCGFASSASYGASSYLIVRPEGNVLVDSPRFASRLVERLEKMGGVRWMFLSHQDDIADHERFHRHFGCERIFHARELGRRTAPKASDFECIIQPGESDEKNEPIWIAPDLLIIPTPGHTRGHMVLLYRERFLFTGDHLWWSPERQQLGASRSYCWYSWEEQTRSMERLLDYRFEWVLPGHGRRHHASAETMHELLADCVRNMKRR